jgi:hypothetical protein
VALVVAGVAVRVVSVISGSAGSGALWMWGLGSFCGVRGAVAVAEYEPLPDDQQVTGDECAANVYEHAEYVCFLFDFCPY